MLQKKTTTTVNQKLKNRVGQEKNTFREIRYGVSVLKNDSTAKRACLGRSSVGQQ